MNLIKLFVGAVSLFSAGIFVPATQAAKVDFTPLEGEYKASYVLATGTATFASSDLKVTVTVSKSGNGAKMEILGFISDPSMPATVYAAVGNLSFTSQKVSANNALLALYVQLPAASLASSSKNKIRFTLVNSTLGSSSAINMAYTLRFNKKKFSIIGNGTLGSAGCAVVLKGKRVGK